MVPVDHHGVAVKCGRASFAMAVFDLHIAKILFPGELAIDVETVDPSRAEGGYDILSVGNRGVGSPASRYMGTLMRSLLVDGLLPENRSINSVDRQDYRALVELGGQVVVVAVRVFVFFLRRFPEGRCRGQEDAIPPDDGCRVPLPRKRCFPADVFFLAPLDRRCAAGRRPRSERAAPAGPLLRGVEVLPVLLGFGGGRRFPLALLGGLRRCLPAAGAQRGQQKKRQEEARRPAGVVFLCAHYISRFRSSRTPLRITSCPFAS